MAKTTISAFIDELKKLKTVLDKNFPKYAIRAILDIDIFCAPMARERAVKYGFEITEKGIRFTVNSAEDFSRFYLQLNDLYEDLLKAAQSGLVPK